MNRSSDFYMQDDMLRLRAKAAMSELARCLIDIRGVLDCRLIDSDDRTRIVLCCRSLSHFLNADRRGIGKIAPPSIHGNVCRCWRGACRLLCRSRKRVLNNASEKKEGDI